MDEHVRSVAKAAVAQGLCTVAKGKLAIDRRRADPESGRLLDVVSRCLRDDFDEQDRRAFSAVEDRRRVMLHSSVELTKVDFGAGTSVSHMSETDMSNGVVKRTTIADVCELTSKSSLWAKLLYALVDEYKPKMALELGTSVGISAGYLGSALRRHGGRLVTIEGAQEIADVAQATVHALELDEIVDIKVGRFNDVLPTCLLPETELGFVFIDGHHDEIATQQYYQMIKPYLSPAAVLVFDDIHWSPGMQRAWSAIAADRDLGVTVDVIANGIAILGPKKKRDYRYQLRGLN